MADAAQRRAYLQAMGVQPWVRRDSDALSAEAPAVEKDAVPVAASAPPVVERPLDADAAEAAKSAVADVPVETSPLPSMSVAKEGRGDGAAAPPPSELSAASAMASSAESQPAEPVSAEPPSVAPAAESTVTPSAPAPATAQETTISSLDWDALQAAVSQCTACELHASRTQAVFGVGDRRADWMIIGEAPGEEEDRQGEPFIGRAGQLLNNMLRAVDLSREQVYIANVIKCHPPGDRNPHVDEIAQCFGYLQRQIELVQPKLILVVGRVAAHALLKVNDPLGKLRGRVHQFADVPLVVTYHPAYLLRKPSEKAKSWQDLRLARRVLLDEAGQSGVSA